MTSPPAAPPASAVPGPAAPPTPDSDLAARKQAARSLARSRLRALPHDLLDTESVAVCRAISSSPVWSRARRVGLYVPSAPLREVDALPLLLAKLAEEGSAVYVPRVQPGQAAAMQLLRLRSLGDLSTSGKGILEPTEREEAGGAQGASLREDALGCGEPLDLLLLPGEQEAIVFSFLHCIALHCIALHCISEFQERGPRGGGTRCRARVASCPSPRLFFGNKLRKPFPPMNHMRFLLHYTLITLLLHAGLAFDEAGGRLGRGGGYYDAFLGRYAAAAAHRGWPPLLTVALAFSVQVMPLAAAPGSSGVPMGEHDVRVGMLGTKDGLVECHPGPSAAGFRVDAGI